MARLWHGAMVVGLLAGCGGAVAGGGVAGAGSGVAGAGSGVAGAGSGVAGAGPNLQTAPGWSPASSAAASALDAGVAAAELKGGALVVVATADWCEPCNELHHRFLDTPAGQTALASHVLREFDVDTSTGNAVAAQLRVLGYPTTLVLRRHDGQLVEMGRVEGFDSAAEYQHTLQELLAKTTAIGWCAEPLPAALPASTEPQVVLPVLRCAAASLRSPTADGAALVLTAFVDDPARWAAAAQWPETARVEVLGAVRLLGRYQTRVRGEHLLCAQTFGAMLAFAGTPDQGKPGYHYWRAKCLLRGGQPDAARHQLEGLLRDKANAVGTAELVADFVVHEALKQPWGPAWAQALLNAVLAQKPDNHWAHYLLGTLHTKAGRVQLAKDELALALKLKADSAIYARHLAQLQLIR
ncbi:MAG: hypothetical protein EXR77_12730 [Myxococcales bacterium]|nr:hypothetical protein [Myxococcales bacterium]